MNVALTVNIHIEERIISGRGVPFAPRRVLVVSEEHPGSFMARMEWTIYSRRVAERIAWERQDFWRLSYRSMLQDLMSANKCG